jgi:coiled-coil domain-containing protein 55
MDVNQVKKDETPKTSFGFQKTGFNTGFKKPTLPKFGGFGLKSAKSKKPALAKSAFSQDSDSDEESDPEKQAENSNNTTDFHRKAVNKEINLAETKSKTDRRTQIKIQAALEQDSKIFEYDEVYGDVSNFQKGKDEEERRKKLNLSIKKPKYIKGMLKTAAKRQLEDERRYERRSIKDRKDEDHLFDDKEKFITNAYKEKMIKLEQAEEAINRRDEIDRLQSVEKQTGLAGFYRHLLNDKEKDQKIKDEEAEMQIQKELKEEKVKKEAEDAENTNNSKVKTEADENSEKLEPTGNVETEAEKPAESSENKQKRYDSDSSGSDSDSGSDVSSTGRGRSSGSSIDEERFGEGEVDPETKAFNEKFGTKFAKSRPSHPAAPSTTMTKASMRSRITAGGAGVETEIDWEVQLEKLNVIFKLRNSEEDVEVASRRYFQRQAMREARGGWSKILSSK